MAHSGGGGSHGGGSHGGSHGSGKSSRSRTYFPGSYHHSYINRRGRRVSYYSRYAKVSRPSVFGIIFSSLFLAAFTFVFMIASVATSFYIPGKVKDTIPDMQYVVDEADFLTDSEEQELNQVLHAYYEKTGINPCVYLVEPQAWKHQYANLENFGFAYFYSAFQDEKHYLVVYSDEVKENGWHDWYYETIVGDDTTKALGPMGEEYMNNKLQSSLKKMELKDALVYSFERLTTYSGRFHIHPRIFMVIGILIILVGGAAFAMIKQFIDETDEYRYSLGHADTVKNPLEYHMICPQCGKKHPDLADVCDTCGTSLKMKGI